MGLKDALLAEFDYEMANTRKMLQRLPAERLAWKPHAKSMSLGRLAGHVAELPRRTIPTLKAESLDLAPPCAPPREPKVVTSSEDAVAFLDANVARARQALTETSDEELLKPWMLMAGGKTMRTMPRVAAFRALVMSHGIHHRGQLSIYLRENDVPVPGMYGPSADDSGM